MTTTTTTTGHPFYYNDCSVNFIEKEENEEEEGGGLDRNVRFTVFHHCENVMEINVSVSEDWFLHFACFPIC